MWRLCLSTLCLVGFLVSSGNLQAQPPSQPNETKADSAADPADSKSLWQQYIYVPYKNLKQSYENQDGAVFMPYREYLELWKKVSSVIGPDGRLQFAAVITESHYKTVVKENFAEVNATLQVHVLGESWSEVTLELGDAAIGSVSSEQGDVLLRGIGEGKYSLVFEKPGRYTVQMKLNTRVQVSPEGRTITLKIPSVGITTFEMLVPKADQTVDVKPKLVELPAEAVEGETGTRIRGSLGATNQITATWYPRAGLKPDMELLAGVTNLQKITLQEGLVHTEAQLTYSILRGTLGQVRLAIPLGDRILDVNSPDQPIAAWETQQDDKQQTVVVRFLSDINQKVRVDVRTERTLPDEPFQLAGASPEGKPAGVHALDVVRESGQITLSSGSDVNLVVQSADGLVRVIESEVAAEFRRPEAIYYKFYNPKFNLTVEGRPVEPRITVDHQATVEFQEDELSITSQLSYTIERAGVFDVRLRVPKGVTVDNVQAAGLREYNTAGDTLTVSFAEQTQGRVAVQIRGHVKFNAEATTTESFALPLFETLGVERETGVLRVYSPPGLEVIADTEKIIGAVSTAAGGNPQQGEARLAATWSFNRRPVEIPVRTIRRPTRLFAQVGTTIDVQPEATNVRSVLLYRVEYAGIDSFRFAVPEAIADLVRIRSLTDPNAIKQQSRSEEAEEGWVTWTVEMQRKVLGVQRFEVAYELTPGQAADAATEGQVPADAANDATEQNDSRETSGGSESQQDVSVQLVRALPSRINEADVTLTSVTGEVLIQKERSLSLSAEPEGETIEPIDIRELTLLPADGAMAFRYFTQPAALKIEAVRHETQPVVATVISRALVEVVIGRDSRLAVRCRYRLKSSERQRLPFDLPTGAEPLGVTVDRSRVALEKSPGRTTEEGWTAYSVNVARSKSSDEPFVISAQFVLPTGEDPFEKSGGRLRIRLPRLGSEDASTVAVQQLQTVVWIPDEIAFVGSPENFTRLTRSQLAGGLFSRIETQTTLSDLESWIGQDLGGMFDFPTVGHAYRYSNLGGARTIELSWWRIWVPTVVLSVTLILIAWVLRNTSWENKLVILLLLAFAAALYALKDADWVWHAVVAARYGLIFMGAYWIIHSLLRSNNHTTVHSLAPTGVSAGPTAVTAVVPPPGIFDQVTDALQGGKKPK